MDRRSFLASAGLAAGGGVALAAPAIAQSLPQVKWTMTSGFPKTLDILFGTGAAFVKAVAEATDNNFQIDLRATGEIVPTPGVLDAVTKNTVQAAHTCSYYHFGKDPTFAIGTAIPFGLNSRQQQAWFYHGGGNDLMNEFYKGYNLIGFPGGNTGAQMGGWWRKQINTVADLQGIRLRAGGFAGAVLSRLGVVPQSVAAAELYPQLEKGTLDAVEWVGPYDDEKFGFYKVAPYYYYPGWWEGGASLHFWVNLEEWNKLPKNYQSLVQTAAAMANLDMQARYDAHNPAAIRSLFNRGVKLSAFPNEVLDACFKAANEAYAEINASNLAFKKIYDSQMAFRREGYLWQQVADGPYDNYMMAQQRAGAL